MSCLISFFMSRTASTLFQPSCGLFHHGISEIFIVGDLMLILFVNNKKPFFKREEELLTGFTGKIWHFRSSCILRKIFCGNLNEAISLVEILVFGGKHGDRTLFNLNKKSSTSTFLFNFPFRSHLKTLGKL